MSSLSRFDPKFGIGQQRSAINTVTSMSGYINCDGSVLSQASYPALYSKIGLIPNNLLNYTSTTTFAQRPNAIIYGGGLYVTAGNSGSVYSSTDAITWTARTTGTTTNLTSIAYGNSVYVVGINTATANASNVATSTDAITWTIQSFINGRKTISLIYDSNSALFIRGNDGGVVSTSTNGVSWSTRTTALSNNVYVAYGNSKYVAMSGAFITYTATNPTAAWSVVEANTIGDGNIAGLIFQNGYFICFDGGNSVWISTDAKYWTKTFTTSQSIQAIQGLGSYGVLILGSNGYLYYSYNLTDWTRLNSKEGLQTGSNYNAALLNGNTFMISVGGIMNTTTNPFTYNTATDFVLPLSYPVVGNVNNLNTTYFKLS